MEKYNIFNAVSVFESAESKKKILSRSGLELADLECDVIDNSVMQKICEKDLTTEAHFIECKKVVDVNRLPERPLAFYQYSKSGLTRLPKAQLGCLVVYERVTTGFADITKRVVGMELCGLVRSAQNNIILSDDIYPSGIICSQQIYKAYNEKYGENMLDKLALLFVSAKGSVRFRGRYHKLINELVYQNFLSPLKKIANEKAIQLYATIGERDGISADLPSNINLAGYGCFEKMFIDTNFGVPSNLTIKRYLAFSKFFAFRSTALISSKQVLGRSLDEIREIVDNLFACGIDLIVMDTKSSKDELYKAKANYIKNYCDLVAATCAQMKLPERKLIFYPNFTRLMSYQSDFDLEFCAEIQKLDQNGIAYDICDDLTFKNLAEIKDGKLVIGKCTYDSVVLANTENILFATAKKMQELLQQKIKFYSYGEQLRLIDGVKSSRVESIVKQFNLVKQIEDITDDKLFKLSSFAKCRFGILPDKSLLIFASGRTNADIIFKAKCKIAAVNPLTRTKTEIETQKKLGKKLVSLSGTSQFIEVFKGKKLLYSNSAAVAIQTGEMFTLARGTQNMLPLSKCVFRTTRGRWSEPVKLGSLPETLAKAKNGAEFKFALKCEEFKGTCSLYVPEFTDASVMVNGTSADKNNGMFSISSLLNNGDNEIVVTVPNIANKISECGMIENIFLMGEFAARAYGDIIYDTDRKIYTDGNFVLTTVPEQLDINKIRESGFWYFAGGMELSCTVFVSKRGSSVYKLKFSEMNAQFVDVVVNGIEVGYIGFAPYEINIGDYLYDGENKITVKLYAPDNSLKTKLTESGDYVFEPFGLGASKIDYEFIEFCGVSKSYNVGNEIKTALNCVSFNIQNGEFIVISGPSGSGKTTLLNMLGGMDKCDDGNIVIDGVNIGEFSEKQLSNYRRNDIGFVFQQNNLIDDLTVRENVAIVSRISDDSINANIALDAVGLLDYADSLTLNLSAGQQQRVVVARALAKNPKLLLCDEPTGILNKEESTEILSMIYETCKTTNKTAVVVTNNDEICAKADRVIKLKNGCIVENIINLEC